MLFLNQDFVLNLLAFISNAPLLTIVTLTVIAVLITPFILESKPGKALDLAVKLASLAGAAASVYSVSSSSNDKLNDKKSDNTDKTNSPLSNSFLLFSLFSIEPGSTTLNQFAFTTFSLTLVALSCSINIFFYYLSIYLINKGEYESKYPRLAWIVRRYKNSNQILLGIEIILFYLSLIVLLTLSIILCTK